MAPPICSICLSYASNFGEDHFVSSQCGHLYHYRCIREWLDRSNGTASCPECRSCVEVDSLIKLHGIAPILQAGIEGNELKYNVKIALLGDSGTGKTSMLNSFTHGTFCPAKDATKGIDMGFKTLDFAGKKIKLTVWDCAGQERFRAICPQYIRNCHGAIIVYDIADQKSFGHVDEWLKVVYDSATPEISILLAGNKSDLEESRQVPMEHGINAARSFGFEFMETSAKDVVNLEAAFRTLLGKIVSTMWDEGYIDSFEISPPVVKLSNEAPSISQNSSSRCGRC